MQWQSCLLWDKKTGETAAWNVILIFYHFSIWFLKLALFLFSLPILFLDNIILYSTLCLPVGASISITIFCLTVILKPPFFSLYITYHNICSIPDSVEKRLSVEIKKQIWIQVSFTWVFWAKDLLFPHSHYSITKINGIAYTQNLLSASQVSVKRAFPTHWYNNFQLFVNSVTLESESTLWAVMKTVPQIPSKVSEGLFELVS